MTPAGLHIVSVRTKYTEHATRSNFIIDGENIGYVLEDKVRPDGAPKVHGRTAIPAGLYEVKMHDSPRFKKRLPWLQDVPGFSYILAHGGNTATDTEGCLLVAGKFTALDRIFGSLSDKVAARVDEALKAGKQVWWEVIDTAARPTP